MSEFSGKILLVDDEINVLKSLNRMFITEPIEIIMANSGKEALEILEQGSVDLIISDFKMPEMNGIQLLTDVKQKYPDIMRVILSGYVEIEQIHDALSCGIALSYMTKPWSEYNITDKIRQIMQTIQKLKAEELMDIFNRIDRLPGIPDIFYKLTKAINENRSLKDISNTINIDVALTAKILQIANSPFYGVKSCKSLEQAIMIIGLTVIKDIILLNMLTAHKQLNSEQIIWLNKVMDENICITQGLEKIGSFLDKKHSGHKHNNPGLLSNIGKIILITYLPDLYKEIITKQTSDNISFYDAELALGCKNRTHIEIGCHFLSLCNMPLEIIQPILYSRNKEELLMEDNYLARILHLVCLIMDQATVPVNDLEYPIWTESLISIDNLQQIVKFMEELYGQQN